MPARILVPLDGSPFSEHALPAAAAAARRAGAELHIVHVHEPVAHMYPEGVPVIDVQWDGTVREQEQEYLRSVADRCAGQTGVAPRVELLEGGVLHALRRYVEEAGIDVIMMTTHGRGGISRAWVGSTADALVRRVAAPVLLIRPRTQRLDWNAVPRPGSVLVTLDGSALSEAVLAPALDIARLCTARFTLLRVVLPLPIPLADVAEATAHGDDITADARRAAEQYLDVVADTVRARGFDVDTAVVVHTTPAVAILDYAATHEIDGIAMATRGRGGWSRIALGSVADKVMRGTMMPMLLFRPPAASRDEPLELEQEEGAWATR